MMAPARIQPGYIQQNGLTHDGLSRIKMHFTSRPAGGRNIMEKKLYIHIGGIKTGTTALQHFFTENRQALEAQGFCYPGADPAYWKMCLNLREYSSGGQWTRSGRVVHRYLADIRRSSCDTTVLSDECLSLFGGAEVLRRLIPRSTAVAIVYYVRRQDTLIESFYHELVRTRQYCMKNRLNEEFIKMTITENLCDHSRVIRPWAESFGKENVIIRVFEKQQMAGDIIGDFGNIIGLFPDETFARSRERSNARMDQPHSEFIRLCNHAFPDADDIRAFLLFHRCDRDRLFENLPQHSLLSPKKRIEILQRYDESNQAIARDYMGRRDGRLFYDPLPGSRCAMGALPRPDH